MLIKTYNYNGCVIKKEYGHGQARYSVRIPGTKGQFGPFPTKFKSMGYIDSLDFAPCGLCNQPSVLPLGKVCGPCTEITAIVTEHTDLVRQVLAHLDAVPRDTILDDESPAAM